MKKVKFYMVVSIIIGILQILDGCVYLLANGSITAFNSFFSIFEFMWVLVSIVFIFILNKNQFTILSPISYVIYNVTFWIIGTVVFWGQRESLNFQMPIWTIGIGLIFGIYFAALNYLLYRKTIINIISPVKTEEKSL